MSCLTKPAPVSTVAHLKYRLDGKVKYHILMCNYDETKEQWEKTCRDFWPGSEFVEVRVESCGSNYPEKEIRANE